MYIYIDLLYHKYDTCIYICLILYVYIYIINHNDFVLPKSSINSPLMSHNSLTVTTAALGRAGLGEVSVQVIPGGVVPLRAATEGTSPGGGVPESRPCGGYMVGIYGTSVVSI